MIWNERCIGYRKDGEPCNAHAVIRGYYGGVYCYHHQNQGEFSNIGNLQLPPPSRNAEIIDPVGISILVTLPILAISMLQIDICLGLLLLSWTVTWISPFFKLL
jgi:hypothetical protein